MQHLNRLLILDKYKVWLSWMNKQNLIVINIILCKLQIGIIHIDIQKNQKTKEQDKCRSELVICLFVLHLPVYYKGYRKTARWRGT